MSSHSENQNHGCPKSYSSLQGISHSGSSQKVHKSCRHKPRYLLSHSRTDWRENVMYASPASNLLPGSPLKANSSNLGLWWLPTGRTGPRTLLLYISSLSIFVLRVAQLRLEARNTTSSFVTFTKYLFRFNTVQTLWWYLFSAWWFGEVYIWSASDQVNLGWLVKSG